MKLPRNVKIFRGQLDVVPVMGVIFLLLIFVMLKNFVTFVPGVPVSLVDTGEPGATDASVGRAPVELPEGVEFSGFRGPAMSIIVSAGGRYFFNNRELTAEEVQAELKKAVLRAGEPITLIVQADRAVTHGVLMELNAMARAAGIRDVFHAVKPVR